MKRWIRVGAAVLLGAVCVRPAAPAKTNVLAALSVYDGNWVVTPRATGNEAVKIDRLSNHCKMMDAFFSCEQAVNGTPAALLVFTAGAQAGSYRTNVVMADGSGREQPGDLTIVGNHWTFVSKDGSGKPSFRVENFFKDRDHIHFEQYQPGESGGWTKVGEGDETREGK
jgi:hypothetical protein